MSRRAPGPMADSPFYSGTFVPIPFSAGDFVGVAPLTWTVDAADVQTLGVSIYGRIATLYLSVVNTTTGGVAGPTLRYNIPPIVTAQFGRLALAPTITMTQVDWVLSHGGTQTIGRVNLTAGAARLDFQRTNTPPANWVVGANGTNVEAIATFPF